MNDGTPKNLMLRPLTRPYVQVAQGTIISNKANNDTANFIANVEVDTSINAPTIIYAMVKGKSIPWYPNGFNYIITDASGNEVTASQVETTLPDSNHLHVLVKDKSLNG